MCGIAGFAGADVAPENARAPLERMIATLGHRGPDGTGFHAAPGVGLAHARLAIIDLAGGDQPIRNPAGDVWTVFNGEIFNYRELRARLQAEGRVFYTQSDTEVIVHLYDRHGDAFVEHLNGQFAIALWDARRRRLLLARDRLGIRPLFHAQAGGRTWFASEAKALMAALPQCAAIDPAGLVQALTFWSAVEPQTLYRGVHSLPPGCLLAVERDGRQALTRYWDWTFPERDGQAYPHGIERAADELRELLVDAVRLQLRADVPVGAYLSGGLDSSGIAALVRAHTGAPLRTFSLAFEDAEFDESAQQQAMVAHLGTEHSTLRCSRGDIGRAFERCVVHAEAPLLRSAPVPMMLLADHVRAQGTKVVLTGEGADEAFAGYDLFKEAKVRRFWAAQPGSSLRPRLLERLYGYLPNSPVRTPGFAQAFFGRDLDAIGRPVFAHLPRWRSAQRALGLLSAELRATWRDWDPAAAYEAVLPEAVARWRPLARDQYVEAKSLLAGYLLSSQGDRPAMAASIEARFPYLDHRVVEFANRLPPHFKLRGLREKDVLRRALRGLLPAEILARTKQPYRAPDSTSFFAGGAPLAYVADLLDAGRIRDAGYFDPQAVARLLAKCAAGRATGFADNQAFLGVLSTMILHERLLGRGRERPAAAPAAA